MRTGRCSASARAWYTLASSGSDPMSDGTPNASENGSLVNAVPGLLRIAGGAWWRTTEWTVKASMQAVERVARAAISGESAAELFREVGTEMRGYVRRLLGFGNIVEAPSGASDARSEPPEPRRADGRRERRPRSLRDRGAE